MSGAPGADAYRVSVKHEVDGVASTFLHNHVQVGDVLEVSAPRGSFTLRPGDGPIVLLSAGIGPIFQICKNGYQFVFVV